MTRFARTMMLAVIVLGAIYVFQGVAKADEPKAPWEKNEDGVVISHNSAKGTSEQRALDFCEEKGSQRLSIRYNSDTISVVCRDDPNTMYTFVR